MRRPGRVLVVAVLLIAAGCGTRLSPGASPTERLASTFEEFAAEHCAAAQALFRGYGNPDTGTLAEPMRDFEAAIERGDVVAATLEAAELGSMFERGREHARRAAGWTPAAAAMVHLDRFLLGMTRAVEAELAGMAHGLAAAKQAAQVAYDAESGPEDWHGWLEGLGTAMSEAGVSDLPACEDVPF